MTRAAYYYPATKAQRAKGMAGVYQLHLIDNGRRTIAHTLSAYSTQDARTLAIRDGATPWNF